MRVYPPVVELTRAPKKDGFLPLSKPVVGVSGKVYKELAVPAGTHMFISTVGYNLYVRLWIHISIRILRVEIITGTRTCGDQTPMSSGQSDGSTWTKNLSLLSGFTVTCM